MNSNDDNKNCLIGFLALFETLSKDGFLGTVLMTNYQGIPQEFRCTHPVKPTVIQKLLYGEMLEPYIGVNLCGVPSFKSIQNIPSLIIVDKEFLLDIRKTISCPVIFIHRAGESIDFKADVDVSTNFKRERVDCASGRFQPLVFTPRPDFNDDITASYLSVLDGIKKSPFSW